MSAEENSHLKLLRRAFADACKINTSNLAQNHIQYIDCYFNVFDELIIIMPLDIAVEVHNDNFKEPRKDLRVAFHYDMENTYFEDNITLNTLKQFIESSN